MEKKMSRCEFCGDALKDIETDVGVCDMCRVIELRKLVNSPRWCQVRGAAMVGEIQNEIDGLLARIRSRRFAA